MTRMADYHPDRKHRSKGLCGACYQHERQAANPEKHRERGRKRYAANPNKARERSRNWRKANPEKGAECHRRWRAANPRYVLERDRNWRAANPEKLRLKVLKTNLRRYGLTPDDFEARVTAQGGVCAICLKPPKGKRDRLCVDHCHDTGRVRGLLCHGCNASLGMLREDPDTIQRLLAYAILN